MGKKIVVIDDDRNILNVLQIALESEGYEVETFSSALGTTSKVLNAKPDLLLVDINMPGLSGPGFINTLKKFNQENSMLMLFHSSVEEEKLKSLADQHGATGYITKGLAIDQFLGIIERYLARPVM
jgi:DNA-binding response OmpR family regulator